MKSQTISSSLSRHIPQLSCGNLRFKGINQSEQLVLLVFALPFRFGEGFDTVGGVFEFLSRQQFGNGEDLQSGIAAWKVF